jgi:hypothetical protein
VTSPDYRAPLRDLLNDLTDAVDQVGRIVVAGSVPAEDLRTHVRELRDRIAGLANLAQARLCVAPPPAPTVSTLVPVQRFAMSGQRVAEQGSVPQPSGAWNRHAPKTRKKRVEMTLTAQV